MNWHWWVIIGAVYGMVTTAWFIEAKPKDKATARIWLLGPVWPLALLLIVGQAFCAKWSKAWAMAELPSPRRLPRGPVEEDRGQVSLHEAADRRRGVRRG